MPTFLANLAKTFFLIFSTFFIKILVFLTRNFSRFQVVITKILLISFYEDRLKMNYEIHIYGGRDLIGYQQKSNLVSRNRFNNKMDISPSNHEWYRDWKELLTKDRIHFLFYSLKKEGILGNKILPPNLGMIKK